jgi:hypothetical protein
MTLIHTFRAVRGAPERRRLVRLAPAVVVSVVLAAVAQPASASADRSCGVRFNAIGPYGVAVQRGAVGCAVARRVLRRYFGSHGRCGGSSCLRRQRGWMCQTALVSVYPRLASCQRGRSLVQAIAIVD